MHTPLKPLVAVHDAPSPHWVGNGFPVRTLFNYREHAQIASPFLLMDYAGPHLFEPGSGKRGVGEHPHKGFETVTIVYEGEVAHRDSTGVGGVIAAGDVQWMTAANGIMHEEFHSDAYTARGGLLEMVQLWVNLPARDKQRGPGYQSIAAASIPVVALSGQAGLSAGRVRVIAGDYQGHLGPAHTHTPMNVWDVCLVAGHGAVLDTPPAHTQILVVLRGRVYINASASAGSTPVTATAAQWVQFEREGSGIELHAQEDSIVLLLSGEPIIEPVAGYGPFVMNTQAEIIQTLADFRSGKFGQLKSAPEAEPV